MTNNPYDESPEHLRLTTEERMRRLRERLNGGAPHIPRLTREQSAILSAYTGVLCGDFEAMHEYIEKLMGRPVWTHEMASDRFQMELKNKAKPDFLKLCYSTED